MSVSNTTHADQRHRIFISSPKPTADRTGFYIILLLFFLVFILIFYLLYNFISFKRYSSSRKNNKKKNYLSSETTVKLYSHPFEELILPSHQIPLQTTTSSSMHKILKQIKKSSSRKQLISDL